MGLISTDLGPVDYVESGVGPPILYFHGTGITCDGMLRIEAPLVNSGFRLVIPSRPGYGVTPLAENRSASACASVVAALMDALGIDAACIMGSSGGAAFATSFAIHHSGRTNCLVLLCPQLHRWSDKTWLPVQSRWTLAFLKNRLLRKMLLKLYAIHFRRMTLDQFTKLQSGVRYDSVRNDPSVRALCCDSLIAMKTELSSPGFENDFIVFTTEDIIKDQDALAIPTMIVHDCCDPIAPVAHVDWFKSIVPNCKCVSIHASGHLVWAGPDVNVMQESRARFIAEHVRARF
jgi:pimeloyl-ACP methyl ester carboxylesterase